MENAADALKIAFAIFVFILAVTVSFGIISQAKGASDVVLYHNDETNFYQYADSSATNRIVTVSEVISTLYRFAEESVVVTVVLDDDEYKFDFNQGDYESIDGEEGAKEDLEEFITTKLNSYYDSKFVEEFVEVPVSGEYQISDDGSEQVTLSSGETEIYITYSLYRGD